MLSAAEPAYSFSPTMFLRRFGACLDESVPSNEGLYAFSGITRGFVALSTVPGSQHMVLVNPSFCLPSFPLRLPTALAARETLPRL
jgi:hypothetical protein